MSSPAVIDRLRAGVEEIVLEEHTKRTSKVRTVEYIGRPVEFAREVCGFKPYAKQCDIIETLFLSDARWLAVRGAHSVGKDATIGGGILHYAAHVLGMLCIVISATERQLLGQTWAEFRRHFSPKLPGRLLSSSFELAGEKRVIAMTSGSTSNLTGWHDANGVLVVISEAQGEQVEAAAFDAAIANATDEKSRILVVGNPVKDSGRFFEIHRKPGWRQIHVSAFDHPNVEQDSPVLPGGPSRQWIKQVAAEYGQDSAYYISRVLGEFPIGRSVNGLIRREWLERAYARYDAHAM
jgi:hypothetical protein